MQKTPPSHLSPRASDSAELPASAAAAPATATPGSGGIASLAAAPTAVAPDIRFTPTALTNSLSPAPYVFSPYSPSNFMTTTTETGGIHTSASGILRSSAPFILGTPLPAASAAAAPSGTAPESNEAARRTPTTAGIPMALPLAAFNLLSFNEFVEQKQASAAVPASDCRPDAQIMGTMQTASNNLNPPFEYISSEIDKILDKNELAIEDIQYVLNCIQSHKELNTKLYTFVDRIIEQNSSKFNLPLKADIALAFIPLLQHIKNPIESETSYKKIQIFLNTFIAPALKIQPKFFLEKSDLQFIVANLLTECSTIITLLPFIQQYHSSFLTLSDVIWICRLLSQEKDIDKNAIIQILLVAPCFQPTFVVSLEPASLNLDIISKAICGLIPELQGRFKTSTEDLIIQFLQYSVRIDRQEANNGTVPVLILETILGAIEYSKYNNRLYEAAQAFIRYYLDDFKNIVSRNIFKNINQTASLHFIDTIASHIRENTLRENTLQIFWTLHLRILSKKETSKVELDLHACSYPIARLLCQEGLQLFFTTYSDYRLLLIICGASNNSKLEDIGKMSKLVTMCFKEYESEHNTGWQLRAFRDNKGALQVTPKSSSMHREDKK